MENEKKNTNTDLKKRIIKFFIPFIMLLMIIIIGTVAWFTMNKETDVRKLSMSSVSVPFELATFGGNGYFDSVINYIVDGEVPDNAHDIYEYTADGWVKNNEIKLLKEKEGFFTKLTGQNTVIQWQVNGESNFANYNSEDSENQNNPGNTEFEGSDEEKLEYRLEPGDSGYLEFYIIPENNGTLDLNFTLDVDIFERHTTNFKPESAMKLSDEDTKQQQLILMHHILFFRDFDDENGYSGLLGFEQAETEGAVGKIDFGSDYRMTYTDSIPDAVKGAAYRFRIYWIWPNILGQTLFDKTNDVILNNNNKAIFGVEDERKAYTGKMKTSPEMFFYGYNSEDENASETVDVSALVTDITSETIKKEDTGNDYYKLSYYWNKADQYVGLHISAVTAEMSVAVKE